MLRKELPQAERFAKQNRRRRIWNKVVGALACIVVFCTTYALILPAITLENTTCGLTEHVHTEECYVQVTSREETQLVCSPDTLGLHVHTSDCYDGDGNLICGYGDFVVHTHNNSCYDAEGNLVCQLPEIEVHTHTDSCYAPEGGHTHTEECYTTERGELICGLAEEEGHTHDEACYDENGELICQLPETEGHTHTDECYEQVQVLTCGLEETEPELALVCGKPEVELHTHDETCYDGDGNLICGKLEVLEHVHTEACFQTIEVPVDTETLTCTLPEDENHTHTALCYGTWELVCELPEHIHTDECYAPENNSDPTADVETQADWEATLEDIRLTGNYRVDLLAVAESQLDYTESSRNFTIAEDGRVLGYTRFGEWYGDPYGEWGAMYVSFCLHYAQVPEESFPLDANCGSWVGALQQEEYDLYRTPDTYTPELGDLIFLRYNLNGSADHVGLVAEVIPATEDNPAQLKTIEGDSDNQVQYVTYDLSDERILGYGKLPEQTFYCGQVGHVHSEACMDAEGNLICGLEEHIHTDDCAVPPDQSAEDKNALTQQLTYTGPDYSVQVCYGAEANLPEGVMLAVSEIPMDSEEYRQYYEQSVAAMEAEGTEETVIFARFFDIRFQIDGQELEPAAPVSVTITYAESVETGENVNCQAIHFAEEGPELLEVEAENPEDGTTSFTHTQDGFSVTGNLVTVPGTVNLTDIGLDALTVDYYVCIDNEWVCVGSTKTGWYGDYTATGWTDENRDYITVEQAKSVLGDYGFIGSETNPARVTAYQQKTIDTKIYSDTNTVEIDGNKVIPLSRNSAHAGYNLYYLPANTSTFSGVASPENLDKAANGFYTVKVYDVQGALLTSQIVKTGGSFSYDATESTVTNWLVAYSGGTTETVAGSTITLTNITSAVTVSPKKTDAAEVSHSVTFKVMIDGQWQTVGSLPYYYADTVNGETRAYITSDMAAQFFGDFGYAATTAPEYHFGYSYNDIYSLFYANGNTQTNFCMDVAGGTLAEGQTVQLYTSNGSDAQIFRIWDAGNGYSFITPIGDSAFHVNAYGYATGDPSSTQLKLSRAVNENSQWKVDTGSDGRTTFWSAIAPEDQVIDLDNANMSNGAKLQIWHFSGGARYWYMVQIFRISNNTVSAQNSDGSYNIGLTAESNGDIVCYYLPAETTSNYTNAAESAISSTNSFWSVSVRDDTNTVYSDGALSGMVQYVAPGGEATVTVENADGILWSCVGADDVTTSQSGGYTNFTIKNITQPVEVVATKANPSFTVQYYANIPRLASSGGDAQLAVIDTSGKNLPQNGVTPAYRYLQLEYINAYTNQNRGEATQLFQVKTTIELTKMYSDENFQYETSPDLYYFNKLKDNTDYSLKEIWVLKSGKDPTSTNQSDWDIYAYSADISFTNEAGRVKGNTILINDGAVVRLVFNTSTGDYYNGTTFYDYNISSGYNDGWRTGITGINIESNYGTSQNGNRNWTSYCDVFAFGNQNCGTGMGLYLFDGGYLNSYNRRAGNAYGCTFSLVDGLNKDGTIDYDDWLVVPNLFNDGDASGKQTYSGSSLTFSRVGDTYTLSSATLNNSNGQTNTINQLQYFFNPSPTSGLIYDSSYAYGAIYTNNFWPMDEAASSDRTDANWGMYGSTGYFQGFENSASGTRPGVGLATDFPASDDGNAHNWFFGMNFAISFNLTADYEGPLEYYFFGDDDLWVFLDQTLVCDIGGVHSSVGEYVNLRDYLPVGSSGQHTLTFFYTERGASGSTCYMSFTLPSVSSATTAQDTGSLNIQKTLANTGNVDYSGEEYQFRVELLTAENGSALNQTFSYSRSDGTYGTIKSGGTIALHQNESITISGIPAGTFYRVTELTTEGYTTTVNGNEGYIVSGTIATGVQAPASFVNTVITHALPNTGGAGTNLYTIGGLLLMTGAGILLLYNHTKRRKEDFTSS